MLNELTIENIAVIEKATVNFNSGLNVLTGETGAGKSILIGSLNAILGGRVSRDIVRNGATKAQIWARFSELNQTVKSMLEDAGYEAEDELIISREITAEGKASARVNGKPATAALLKEITSEMINIHGQHDNQILLCQDKHINVLDAYAKNDALKEEYYAAYVVLRDIVRKIKAISVDENEKKQLTDELSQAISEIEEAELTTGEEDTLLAERNKIRNSKMILDGLNQAYIALHGNDSSTNAGDLLGLSMNNMEPLAEISQEYKKIFEKICELYYSVNDISAEIKVSIENYDLDLQSVEEIETRLDVIYKLKTKYGKSVEQLLEYYEESKEKLNSIGFSEEKLEELNKEKIASYTVTKENAAKLTENRLKMFEDFKAQITCALEFLNMPGIKLELKHETNKLAAYGQDTLEFLISTNPGESPKPLAKIASGGELSRIMLAIKSTMADVDNIGTIIYDEIDTGVSGLAAGRIGQKLKETSINHQIICVTHTAQIAAMASSHLLIKKVTENGHTFTNIIPLDEDGRINEVARIISGDKITDISLANAKEMLQLGKYN